MTADLPQINERQEVALRAISKTFGQEYGRQEYGRDLVAGDIARALGQAGFSGMWYSGRRDEPMGWTAALTLRALERRELVRGYHRGNWMVYYEITDLGLRVLAAIDSGDLAVAPSERQRRYRGQLPIDEEAEEFRER